MSRSEPFRYTYTVLLLPMTAVLLIWTVFWAEVRFGVNFNDWGVYPRTLKGLRGVLTSPLIHGSVEHLYNNTLPLAILSAALVYFYRKLSWRVLLWGWLLSGTLTWIIGRASYHIGASGMIYVLASFIFFKGIFTKHYRLVALSLLVVFIYGGLLWYIFPVEEGISWEGHLGGFLSGLALALILPSHTPPPPKYDWERDDYDEEEDEFLQHFDEEGNFIERRSQEDPGTKIIYHFKKNEKKDQSEERDR